MLPSADDEPSLSATSMACASTSTDRATKLLFLVGRRLVPHDGARVECRGKQFAYDGQHLRSRLARLKPPGDRGAQRPIIRPVQHHHVDEPGRAATQCRVQQRRRNPYCYQRTDLTRIHLDEARERE